MPELHLRRAAQKDLRRIGPGPERTRIIAGLARLAEGGENLDIKAIVGSSGWLRLRIGSYRVCYLPTPSINDSGELTLTYAVERIVHRRDLDATAAALPVADDS